MKKRMPRCRGILFSCPGGGLHRSEAPDKALLALREENPAEQVCEQTHAAEKYQHQPEDADDSRVDVKIICDSAANAGDFLVG